VLFETHSSYNIARIY